MITTSPGHNADRFESIECSAVAKHFINTLAHRLEAMGIEISFRRADHIDPGQQFDRYVEIVRDHDGGGRFSTPDYAIRLDQSWYLLSLTKESGLTKQEKDAAHQILGVDGMEAIAKDSEDPGCYGSYDLYTAVRRVGYIIGSPR